MSLVSPLWTMSGWRMGWDSNPRYARTYGGFQDRCLQPLGHPSSGRETRRLGSLSQVSIADRGVLAIPTFDRAGASGQAAPVTPLSTLWQPPSLLAG